MTVATQRYSADSIPQSLTWQALSFLRCEWPFLFTGATRLRSRPFGDASTTYLVRREGEVLLSYAEILRASGGRAGQAVSVIGLSNVFTFPPYRGEGHASAIINAAGELIHDSDADLAILFCENDLVPFYSVRGWQRAPDKSVRAPGTAPATMARPGPNLAVRLDDWLAGAPLLLDSRW